MTKLKPSESFAQSRDVQKLVAEDEVLAYRVFGGGRNTGAVVTALHRAEVHVKTKTRRGKALTHIFSSYEHGERLNGNFFEDEDGAILAQIASLAISALERRAQHRKALEKDQRRAQRKRPNPRTRKRARTRDR